MRVLAVMRGAGRRRHRSRGRTGDGHAVSARPDTARRRPSIAWAIARVVRVCTRSSRRRSSRRIRRRAGRCRPLPRESGGRAAGARGGTGARAAAPRLRRRRAAAEEGRAAAQGHGRAAEAPPKTAAEEDADARRRRRPRRRIPRRRPPAPPAAATTSRPCSSEGADFPYPQYLENVVRVIAQRFKPQGNSAARAEVSFIIRRDGSIVPSSIQFVTRSGNFAFDLEARGRGRASRRGQGVRAAARRLRR